MRRVEPDGLLAIAPMFDAQPSRNKRPLAHALLILFLVAAMGSDGRSEQRRDADDRERPVTILVMTRAPGLSAREVESAVTDPLERRLFEAQGVRQIESHTIAGLSIIRASFRADVAMELALPIVDALVHSAAGGLPVGNAAPLVMPLAFESTPVGYVTVEDPANKLDAGALAELARARLFAPLHAVAASGPCAVLGGKQRVTIVQLDADKLNARQLTAWDVMTALKRHSPPRTSSVFRAGSTAFTIALADPTPTDLAAMPLGAAGGSAGKLADVAEVVETTAITDRSTRVDGVEKVIVPIYAASESDHLHVRDAVGRTIEELNSEAPAARFGFLPLASTKREDDDGLITLEVRLPASKLEVTETDRSLLEAAVRKELADDVSFIVSQVGVCDEWPAALCCNAAESDMTMHVQLSPRRARSTGEAAERLLKIIGAEPQLAHMAILVHTSASEVVELRVADGSEDAYRSLERLLEAVRSELPQSRIVERLNSPLYQFVLDSRKAAELGVTPAQVLATIDVLTGGPAASWTDGPRRMQLQLTSSAGKRSLDGLQNTLVATASGQLVRLGQIVQIRQARLPVEIDHFNLQPVFRAELVVDRSRRDAAISSLTVAAEQIRLPGVPRIEVVNSEPSAEATSYRPKKLEVGR